MSAEPFHYQLSYSDVGKNIKLRPFTELKIRFVSVDDGIANLQVNNDIVLVYFYTGLYQPQQCAVVGKYLYRFTRLRKLKSSIIFSVTKESFPIHADLLYNRRWMLTLSDDRLESLCKSKSYKDICRKSDFIWQRRLSQLLGGISQFMSDSTGEHLDYKVLYRRYSGKNRDEQLVISAKYNLDLVSQKLINDGANIHYNDEKALIEAIKNRSRWTIERLIYQGADVHTSEDLALQVAADFGKDSLVTFLINHGADLNARNGGPLQGAASFNQLSTVELLIQNNADLHAGDDAALKAATKSGNIAILELLLGSSYSRESLDKALILANENGNQRAVDLITQRINSGEY